MRKLFCFLLFIFLVNILSAQELRWIKHQMAMLSSTTMEGRGYVRNGREKAARYISKQYKDFGLKSFTTDSNYFQNYNFDVNTFPGEATLLINKISLQPGVDFLVDAASNGYFTEHSKIIKIDLKKVNNASDWEKIKTKELANLSHIYFLKNSDTLCKRLSLSSYHLAKVLPKGCFIIPVHGKLTWTVSTERLDATVFYVEDSILPKKPKSAYVFLNSELLHRAPSKNIAGYVPGTENSDSFIVITAHYDHLGMMGYEAVFTGASDNASGTALMLSLAKYYAVHPQKYSVAFIAFSGEEAGLLGSKYYTEHPLFPLDKIRFLINLDIMGDASGGIVAVNATEFPEEFSLIQEINDSKNYLPEIRSRGKAANSDHYHFSENGVPCFFFYSIGGPGYYHDVFDKSNTLSMKNVDKVQLLIEDFIGKLQ